MAKNPPAPPAVFRLIVGRFVSHLIYVAAKLELADHLKHGPRTVEELATAAEVQAPALHRVLRALASVGVFAETKDKRFKLTPLAVTLQKAVPNSMHAAALMLAEKYLQDAWAELLHGLKTNEIPFFKAHGVSMFEYLEKHPELRDYLKAHPEVHEELGENPQSFLKSAQQFETPKMKSKPLADATPRMKPKPLAEPKLK